MGINSQQELDDANELISHTRTVTSSPWNLETWFLGAELVAANEWAWVDGSTWDQAFISNTCTIANDNNVNNLLTARYTKNNSSGGLDFKVWNAIQHNPDYGI